MFALATGCSPVTPGVTTMGAARPERPRSGAEAAGAGGAPSGAPREALAWAALDARAFARAAAERRLVVIDGSAEWCHWCHVMEATTYHDPEVRKVLDANFVAVKVDVDSRPDFEERYGEWGWPATVLMTADGRELGKYKGYLPPAQFAEILRAAVAGKQAIDASSGGSGDAEGDGHAITEAEREAARARVEKQLDEYWDPEQGGWGAKQKAPLVWENAWALERAGARTRQSDATQRSRVLFTLDRQRALIDPVWGGVCQYSAGSDWTHPHHEKLMAVQAGAIASYARAFALTGDARWLATAQQVRGFVDRFLTGPDGAFLTTMDADLNAHEPPGSGKPYMAGDAYYAKDDAGRRALGIPRVDDHAYARENGLAIDAYVTLFDASGDRSALEAARRAATTVLATHAVDRGGATAVTHASTPDDDASVLYLADNAALGFGLVHLYEATHDPATLAVARGLADFVLRDLMDPRGGGFYASTPDPHAVGVFALRGKPVEHDAMAIRFLERLDRVAPDARYADAVERALPIVTRPEAVEARGRFVGDVLLAIDEAPSRGTTADQPPTR
jgi:uncharacterized protein YyaL (SSP411 family)